MTYSLGKRNLATLLGLAMLASLFVAVPAASAGTPVFSFERAELFAPTPQVDGSFGAAVAISGDTLVVGEPDHVTGVIGAAPVHVGAAFVYVRNGSAWVFQQQLGPALQDDTEFGSTVAIYGDVIVIGSPGYTTGNGKTGAAFVFRNINGTWALEKSLIGTGVTAGARYGSSVAIDGSTIVVGAPLDGFGTVRPYIRSGSDWVSQGTLSFPDAAAGDQLGGSVAIEGDTIIAGAPADDYGTVHALTDAGSAHFYARSGGVWTHKQTIYPPDAQAGASFGGPIAISGGRILVGSMFKTVNALAFAGGAYSFTSDGATYHYERMFTAPTPTTQDYYGSSVALDGPTALIGSYWADDYHGTAYFYSHVAGVWTMRERLDMTARTPSVALMGMSAAMSGGTAVIGAPTSNAPSTLTAGSAFVYTTRGKISGIARDNVTDLPVAGIEVSAYVPDEYGDPELAGMTNTDASGYYSISLPTGDYAIGWMDGTQTYYPGFHDGVQTYSQSTTVGVWAAATTNLDVFLNPKPKATLSKPSGPSSIGKKHGFKVTGYLKPLHAAGSYPVEIRCYRRERGRDGHYYYILRKTVLARARTYRPRRGAAYTKYSVRLSLPSKGKWKIYAYHVDAEHGPTTSRGRNVIVR